MMKINTDVNLQSKPMDISPPLEANDPLDINKAKTEQEENMTLLSSSIEQVRLYYPSTADNARYYC